MTHTYAVLTVAPDTYDYIAILLRLAGYDHAFVDGLIDMHGIALASGPRKGAPTTGAPDNALAQSD
jgi:hypothetical protein